MYDNQSMNPWLASVLGGGAPSSTPQFTKISSGLQTKKRDGIKYITHDPVTGEKIAKKDQRKLKNFLMNPSLITPANALNMNIPQAPAYGGLGSNLANLLKSARGM